MSGPNQSIRVVSRRTGISPHLIRIWEKRYGAVHPMRTETNRRLYSEDEVERLGLLRLATEAGHSIGHVARLTVEELRKLVDLSHAAGRGGTGNGKLANAAEAMRLPRLLEAALAAIRALDAQELEEVLRRASIAWGTQGLLQKLLGPLAERLGAEWQAGEITAAQEHFASATIRTFVGRMARPFAVADGAPTLVVATPSGQLHELGAIMAAAAAAAQGWRVVYLGAGLPPAEISGAARQPGVRAVALSLVYPTDDPRLPSELAELRRGLTPEIEILVGGRAAEAYRASIAGIGATLVRTWPELSGRLDALRWSPTASMGPGGSQTHAV
ncbi:MAG: MerR family transcriptional regulator [Verrucomicrobia bacterium]|nr:MerR family transcriptional regulator [Verrucomicrobiota bacterium]